MFAVSYGRVVFFFPIILNPNVGEDSAKSFWGKSAGDRVPEKKIGYPSFSMFNCWPIHSHSSF